MQGLMRRTPTAILLLVAALALGLWAYSEAHDPHQHAAEAIVDLKARMDVQESRALNQGAAMDEVFRLIDNLKARIDALAGSTISHSVTIDDLYDAIDRINQRLGDDRQDE